MNKEAVEFVRGTLAVKVFQQTIYSFKNFHAAIEEYKNMPWICNSLSYPIGLGFNIFKWNFYFADPNALMLSAASGQADRQETVFRFPVLQVCLRQSCTTMMNRIMFASEQLMAAKSAVR